MAAQTYKYPNPPIQEVVCEMHFALDEPLSLSKIEKLKGFWSDEYPDQKVNEEKNVQLQVDPGGMRVEEKKVGYRLICRTSDGTGIVQLAGRFLAVNHLKPYPGWEEGFRDTILLRFNELQSAIGPLPINRSGLRYINKIEIAEHPLTWENWFNFSLPLPKIEGSTLEGFQMHFEQTLPASCHLIVNCTAVPPTSPDSASVILDLDVVWQRATDELLEVPEILERVHAPHRLAFEAYLTNKLRSQFS